MSARHGRPRAVVPVVLVALAALAGCAGLAPPDAGTATTTATPTMNGSDAERAALAAERAYVFDVQVPPDPDAAGTGGIATRRALAVTSTADGWFVRVRYGFFFERNTSEGVRHADGVTQAAYFVTPDDTTRVSVPGDEIGGSASTGGDAELDVRVVNAADTATDVSLTVAPVDGERLYARETTVIETHAAHTPRLAVPAGEYLVTATVDGTTRRTTVSAAADGGPPTRVGVFVAPDGTVRIVRTSSLH